MSFPNLGILLSSLIISVTPCLNIRHREVAKHIVCEIIVTVTRIYLFLLLLDRILFVAIYNLHGIASSDGLEWPSPMLWWILLAAQLWHKQHHSCVSEELLGHLLERFCCLPDAYLIFPHEHSALSEIWEQSVVGRGSAHSGFQPSSIVGHLGQADASLLTQMACLITHPHNSSDHLFCSNKQK